MPILLGVIGLFWLLNLFGTADAEAKYYRGREFWFPILPGDEKATHRFIGGIMVAIAMLFGIFLPRFC